MANPFYVQPGNDFGQGLAGLGQAFERTGEIKRQREEETRVKKRFEDAKAAMTAAFQSGDPDQIMQASIDYPELQKTGEMMFGFTNDKTKEVVRDTYRRVLSDPQNAQQYLQDGINRVAEFGGKPVNMTTDLGMFLKNPDAAYKSVRSGFALIAPEEYKAMFPQDSESQQDARTMFLTSLGYEPGTPEYRAAAEQFYVRKGKAGGVPGAFAGTGIENQMLNIALDPNIPESDPRKIVARQRLERDLTTVTPEGTFIRPGYDLPQVAPAPSAEQKPADQPAQFVEKPPTEGQAKASGFHDRMISAQAELSSLGDYDPIASTEAALGATNVTATAEKQRFNQAANDWIRAKLRKESGAVIGDEEMAAEYRTYFPIYGDSKEVIEQKARARKVAEDAMLRDADPGYRKTAVGSTEVQKVGRFNVRAK